MIDTELNTLISFLEPLQGNALSGYVDNIHGKLFYLTVNDKIVPILDPEPRETNSWVVSPTSHYYRYALHELEKLRHPLLKGGAKLGTELMEPLFRLCHLDRVLIVNGLPFATSLCPSLNPSEIGQVHDQLLQLYPDRCILWRCFTNEYHSSILASFRSLRYRLIPSRVVYFSDPAQDRSFQSRMIKSDRKLQEEMGYEVIEKEALRREDLPRITELYRLLNTEKYSHLNPQLNPQFFRHALETDFIQFKALQKEGRIDAILGYYTMEDQLTGPIFGYDTSQDPENGLYRLISLMLAQEARKKGLLLHQSAGAGSFKRLRRAEAALEFDAVFDRHLPKWRRIPWQFLQTSFQTLGSKTKQLMDQ